MLHHRFISRSRAVTQRCAAVLAVASVALTGSAAIASAAPHFSTTGTLATTPTMGAAQPFITLAKPGQPTVTITCTGMSLTAGPATGNASQGWLSALGSSGTTACTGSDGYTYNVSSTTAANRELLYTGTTFYFSVSGVAWSIDGGPSGVFRYFRPAPYKMYWYNPSPPARPTSVLALAQASLGTSVGMFPGWTASIIGAWDVTTLSGGTITALL